MALKVKLSVQITTVLAVESQNPSPISQWAKLILFNWILIFNGTIFMYLLFSTDHKFHSLWISVKAGKALLLKAYWLTGKPEF